MKKTILLSIVISSLNACVPTVNVNTPSSTPNSSQQGTNNNSGTVGKDIISVGANLEVKSPTSLKTSDFKLESDSNATKMTLTKFTFNPDEEIKIKLVAPESYYSVDAWVGINNEKSASGDSKTNDATDIAYVYLNTVKGMEFVTLKAPINAGIYELRLNDGNSETSKEVNKIKFVVSNSDSITDNKIKLAKNTFKKGEKIALEYEAGLEIMDKKPWIGVVPSNIPHVDATLNDQHDIDYKYLDGKNKATVIFDSENYATGKYDFRLNDDNIGKEVIYISFEILP